MQNAKIFFPLESYVKLILNEISLDTLKTEFINQYPTNYMGEPEFGGMFYHFSLCKVLEIIDHISKESGDDKE